MSYITKHYKLVNQPVSSVNLNIPDIQRPIIDEHSDEIYQFEKSFYDNHGEYCLHGNITIAIDNETKLNYLIDGQHRLSAYKKLLDDYPERQLQISIDCYEYDNNCNSKDRCTDDNLNLIYKMINTNKTNPITKLSIDNYKIINETMKYLCSNFKEYVKNSTTPHKPSFNPETIKDKLIESNVIDVLHITTSQELIERIIELNKFYGTVKQETFRKWGIKNVSTIFDRITHMSNKFYLGLYRTEWIDVIANNPEQNYNQIEHLAEGTRTPISKTLRTKVWGFKTIEGVCYCCGQSITINNFECGHIVPVAKGGKTILSNLKPVCRQCNNDMGTMNMEDYKHKIQLELGNN